MLVSNFVMIFLYSIKDLPAAIAMTGYRDENGGIHILIINEALFFWQQMEHSLINPNQIRRYGIPLSDDLYDDTGDLGIEHSDSDISSPSRARVALYSLNLLRPQGTK